MYLKYLLTFLLAYFLIGCGGGSSSTKTSSTQKVLDTTIIKTINGEEIVVDKTSNGFIFHGFENKIVLLEVYGDTCPHCKAAIPHYNELQKKYKNDMVVIALESYGSLINASKQQYITIPKANSGKMFEFIKSLTGYSQEIVPYLIILDRNGDYVYQKAVPNFNEVENYIQSLL